MPPGGPGWRWCRSTPSCTRARSNSSSATPVRPCCSSPTISPPTCSRCSAACPALRQVFTPGEPAYEAALAAPAMAPAHRAPDDLAWLFYTSGTTGRPKGVMQTHRNLHAMTSCYFIDVDDVQADDAIVYAAPMSHGAGLYNFAVRRPGGAPCRAGLGRLRPGRAGGAVAQRRPAVPVRRADHGQAAGRAHRRQRRAGGRLQDHRLRRRADVRRRHPGARWRRWGRASCRSTARASRR